MKRRIEFHPEFERDVQDYGDWIEFESPGMGEAFAQAVGSAVQSLDEMPDRHRVLISPYRRVLIRRFSVLIPFRFIGDDIRVLGVVHGARDIERWIKRRTQA